MSMKSTSIKEFLKRKNVNITVQTYLIDALGAMAFGLLRPCSSEPSSAHWASSSALRSSM